MPVTNERRFWFREKVTRRSEETRKSVRFLFKTFVCCELNHFLKCCPLLSFSKPFQKAIEFLSKVRKC